MIANTAIPSAASGVMNIGRGSTCGRTNSAKRRIEDRNPADRCQAVEFGVGYVIERGSRRLEPLKSADPRARANENSGSPLPSIGEGNGEPRFTGSNGIPSAYRTDRAEAERLCLCLLTCVATWG